jgi:hypothetical protein
MTAQTSPAPISPEANSAQAPQVKANIDFAWRAHTALENWTGKLDTKASIFFTVNVAGLAALLALRTQADGRLSQLHGWHEALADSGILLCGFAVVMAAAAVFPRLGRTKDHRTQRDIIYFGHLRHQTPDDVARQIMMLTEQSQAEQLSRQLIVMAKANWAKHRLVQAALLTSLAGYGAVLLAFMRTVGSWPG